MMRTLKQQHGYSLSELLTVVAIIGIVVAVSIPAILQLYPQYRLRATGSELASTVRMARQKAIGTRSPWRVAFDFANDRYTVMRLKGTAGVYRAFPAAPGNSKIAEITNAAWWVPVDRRGRDLTGTTPEWRTTPGVDLRASAVSNFFHTDCTGAASLPGPDLVFLPNGAVARNPDCAAPSVDLDFVDAGGNELLPEVVLAINNRWVAKNRYRLKLKPTGAVIVVSEKQ